MENARNQALITILGLALSLLVVVTLAACGGPTAEQSEQTPTQDSTEQSSAQGSAEQWPAQEALRSIGPDGISDISYTLYTEGGTLNRRTEDPEEIEEIYLRLCNIRLAGATLAGVDDDGLRLQIKAGKQEFEFEFEGNVAILDADHRFEVEQLGSLKSYLTTLAEEAQAGDSRPDTGGMSVFASDSMDFSFLYDSAHTAYVTKDGACELAVNGDDSLVGLYVATVDATSLPEVSQIIEEGMFNERQKYLNAIAQPPAENEITVDGHTLQGYIFSYSGPQGNTVDCTYYIESRDGRYVYYRTEVYRHAEDYWAGQEALETAARTLEFSSGAYGESDAVPGEIGGGTSR